MPEPTSGTFTFLLSDIEGSTQLARRLGDGWGGVLADHHRLLRTAFEQAGGEGIGTQGDAFFVAFRRPKDAVLSALAAQRSLATHPWRARAARSCSPRRHPRCSTTRSTTARPSRWSTWASTN